MRLINIGAGEITDRLTILALKILTGEAAGKDTTHFENERTALLVLIRTRTLNGSWFQQVLELGAVNAALWYAEDHLREIRGLSDPVSLAPAIIALAFRIQDLNDQRAQLVEAINKLSGDHIGPEKQP
jgi:hypothetical protein